MGRKGSHEGHGDSPEKKQAGSGDSSSAFHSDGYGDPVLKPGIPKMDNSKPLLEPLPTGDQYRSPDRDSSAHLPDIVQDRISFQTSVDGHSGVSFERRNRLYQPQWDKQLSAQDAQNWMNNGQLQYHPETGLLSAKLPMQSVTGETIQKDFVLMPLPNGTYVFCTDGGPLNDYYRGKYQKVSGGQLDVALNASAQEYLRMRSVVSALADSNTVNTSGQESKFPLQGRVEEKKPYNPVQNFARTNPLSGQADQHVIMPPPGQQRSPLQGNVQDQSIGRPLQGNVQDQNRFEGHPLNGTIDNQNFPKQAEINHRVIGKGTVDINLYGGITDAVDKHLKYYRTLNQPKTDASVYDTVRLDDGRDYVLYRSAVMNREQMAAARGREVVSPAELGINSDASYFVRDGNKYYKAYPIELSNHSHYDQPVVPAQNMIPQQQFQPQGRMPDYRYLQNQNQARPYYSGQEVQQGYIPTQPGALPYNPGQIPMKNLNDYPQVQGQSPGQQIYEQTGQAGFVPGNAGISRIPIGIPGLNRLNRVLPGAGVYQRGGVGNAMIQRGLYRVINKIHF